MILSIRVPLARTLISVYSKRSSESQRTSSQVQERSQSGHRVMSALFTSANGQGSIFEPSLSISNKTSCPRFRTQIRTFHYEWGTEGRRKRRAISLSRVRADCFQTASRASGRPNQWQVSQGRIERATANTLAKRSKRRVTRVREVRVRRRRRS